jgi:hypothetical protein
VGQRGAVPPFTGVRVAAALPDSLLLRCRAALLLHPTAAVSHASAALLRDLPLPGAGDAVLRRGLATVEDPERIASGARHRRGMRLLRLALPLLEPRTDSPMETRLRLLLVRAGLPRPAADHDVVEDGQWIARPDLSYP